MNLKQYAIKDELTEFMPLIVLFEEEPQARRWFREYVANNSMIRNNPEDFSLWLVGEFDSKTGCTNNGLPFPELIERAKGANPENGNKE